MFNGKKASVAGAEGKRAVGQGISERRRPVVKDKGMDFVFVLM